MHLNVRRCRKQVETFSTFNEKGIENERSRKKQITKKNYMYYTMTCILLHKKTKGANFVSKDPKNKTKNSKCHFLNYPSKFVVVVVN